MFHFGLIFEMVGFLLVAVIVSIGFIHKAQIPGLKNYLDKRKGWIIQRADSSDNKVWKWLASPERVTFLTLVIGTFLLLLGKIFESATIW